MVRLSVDPADPVSELSNANVTLMCFAETFDVGTTGDDADRFLAVRWFLDGELLKVRIYPKPMIPL